MQVGNLHSNRLQYSMVYSKLHDLHKLCFENYGIGGQQAPHEFIYIDEAGFNLAKRRWPGQNVMWRWKVYDHEPHEQMSLLEVMDAGSKGGSDIPSSFIPGASPWMISDVILMKTCGLTLKIAEIRDSNFVGGFVPPLFCCCFFVQNALVCFMDILFTVSNTVKLFLFYQTVFLLYLL